MTGKQQKAINDAEEMKKACELTLEERAELIDEVIMEVNAKNAEFLQTYNIPIKTFRGMYQVHILFRQIDEEIERRCEQILVNKVKKYTEEQELKRRK